MDDRMTTTTQSFRVPAEGRRLPAASAFLGLPELAGPSAMGVRPIFSAR